MKTARLLAAAYPILAVLALAPPVPGLSPFLALVVIVILGELWLRALIREPLTPVARSGLSIVAGLISLPMIALALHALTLRIEGRGLATGLAALATALGAVALKRTPVVGAAPSEATPPHPVHWVGPVEQPGTTVSGRSSTASAAAIEATPPHPVHWVGSVEREGATDSQRLSTGSGRPPTSSRRFPTALAVGVPTVLALAIGGTATIVYQRLPHPAEPGYTSLALSGWAAGIARPIAIPLGGVEVPVELSSAGQQSTTADLQVRIGDRASGPTQTIPITNGTTALRVHIPAPTDGCLRPIRISVGPASTVFYGRGPFPARVLTRRGPTPC